MALLAGEVHQRRSHRGRALRGRRSGVLAGDGERQADVLDDVEQRDQVERLEDEPGALAAEARRLVVGEAADVLALEEHLAGRGPVQAAQELEQGALARAGRAHQGHELAGRHGERHAAHGLHRLAGHRVLLGEVRASRMGRVAAPPCVGAASGAGAVCVMRLVGLRAAAV